MALAIWNMLTPLPEGTTSIEVVFRMLDIPVPSRLATELYQRVCLIGSIGHEISEAKRKKPDPKMGEQDLLAGTSFGEDDDEED